MREVGFAAAVVALKYLATKYTAVVDRAAAAVADRFRNIFVLNLAP